MPDGDAKAYEPASPKTYGPHPDAVARKRMLWQRAKVQVTLALAMTVPLKPKPERRSGNPKPKSRARPKTCHRCLKTWPQSKGYFSHHRETVCYECTQKLDARRRERQAALADWQRDFNERRRNDRLD